MRQTRALMDGNSNLEDELGPQKVNLEKLIKVFHQILTNKN